MDGLSGRWRGWFGQAGTHHGMEMVLSEAGGSVVGGGLDAVGPFKIAGSRLQAVVRWAKSYSTHVVLYDGAFDGHFIRGIWRLPSGTTGDFCLWPDGAGPMKVESESKPEAEPKAA